MEQEIQEFDKNVNSICSELADKIASVASKNLNETIGALAHMAGCLAILKSDSERLDHEEKCRMMLGIVAITANVLGIDIKPLDDKKTSFSMQRGETLQ